MGGVGDSGIDVDARSSPHRAAIEKAQADLRLEYDVCEEKRRELEFLEKGGNPLDFKFGHPTSVSVLAISLTDQHPHQFVTSEAKGNFSLSASLRGDSVESCGRLEAIVSREPNSGDNFDGEIELLENKRKLLKRNRSTITPSEHSSQLDGSKNAKDLEDVFHFKKGQAYRRRNQSRINRDIESRGAQSSSIDIESCGGHGASIPSRYGVVSWTVNPDTQFEMKFDGAHAMLEDKVGGLANKDLEAEQHIESIRADGDAFGMTSWEPHSVRGREHAVPAGLVCPPLVGAQKTENHGSPEQLNESNNLKGDGKCTPTEGIMSNIAFTTKGLDSESSCTQASFSVEGNANTYSDVCTNSKNVDCNGAPNGQELEIVETLEMFNNKDDQTFKGKNVTNAVGSGFCASNNCNSIVQVHQGNCLTDKGGEEINKGIWSRKNEAKCSSNFEEREPDKYTESKSQTKEDAHDDSTPMLESHCPEKLQASRDSSIHELTETELSGPSPAPELRTCCDDHLKVVDKEHEDRILDEARIIEAKRKTIAELSVHSLPTDSPKRSHWHFVLEEMAWLANDFAQERLWGMTAAAQICHSAAFAARLRPDEQSKHGKLKIVAHTLAKAVIEFWHSAEHGMDDDGKISGLEDCKNDAIELRTEEITKCRIGGSDKELNTDSEHGLKCRRKNLMLAVQRYAVRFLQYNASTTPVVNAGVSETYDRASHVNISALPWQDQFAKEKLFYTVPPGAMEIYRKFIESDLVQREGNNMQVDADKSMHVAAAAFGSKENVYEEDGEESVYYLPGAVEGSRSLKIVQKKRKNLKSYTAGSYELEGDFAYRQCAENIFNVGSIPAKRMRTASRQRAVGPFNIGAVWGVPAQSRTDASSEDTNSFQDDQNTLRYGSIIPMGSEVESGMDFDKYSTLDPMEFSAISKKKKKPKHQASVCDQRWQVDSLQNEQDHLKERLDSHQLESNGSNGLFGQRAKKLKIMKQSLDNSFENRNPVSGSIASPVASQMSNMSNPNRLIKLICGRDQGRKAKLPKVSAGQPGSGSPWSLFEDQALVVLVHDLGPNWELVSDAINRTLQFKCIFRKPNECKERHKILIDRTSIDGADNTEDSRFSQPYLSTLPGIPKGSARQLLQRLQGPLEEEIIKSHFEKIILIGQQLHYPRKKNGDQDLKQIAPVHGLHVTALSKVVPNNLNGGVLTPLDLCDVSTSSPDVFSLGCQCPHTGGLAISNQGGVPQMLPSPGANSSLQGSPGISVGSNFTSPSAQLNILGWAGRYGVPRTTSLPVDEQQRIQQYSHMLSNRSIQHLSVPGSFSGTDQNIHMLSDGNAMSMMPGMNRSMPMPRPGFRGISSSAMLNSETMVSSSMIGMPRTINIKTGAGPAQGNSMLRHHDALHLVRPGQNAEHQKQIMLPEMQLQMQQTQEKSQGVPPFADLSSALANQSVSPPVDTYPVHHRPHQYQVPQQHSKVLSNSNHPHLPGSTPSIMGEQKACALRIARERQLQQRMLQRQQRQQNQFPASNALMSNVQTQSEPPLSFSSQNSSQIPSLSTSLPVSLPPLTLSPMQPTSSQQQQKHQLRPQGLGQNPQSGVSGATNQIGKQRQRQPQLQPQQFQQTGRRHPQQCQQLESLQHAKLLKGIGRDNMLINQNIPLDPSHLNALSAAPVNQLMEKGEQPMHLIQGKGLYSGSGMNSVQQSKPAVPSQPSRQSLTKQKPYPSSTPASLKQVQKIPSHPESSNQSRVTAVPSAVGLPASSQAVYPSMIPSPSNQQLQVQPKPVLKLVNKRQATIQRSIKQNLIVGSDPMAHSQVEQAQNSTPPLGTNSGSLAVCIESVNPLPLPSSASRPNTTPSKTSESLCHSVMANFSTQMGSTGGPSIPISSMNEPLPSGSAGLGHGQLSSNLSSSAQGVEAQWQQQQQQQQLQQSQLQPPPPLQPVLQQNQSHQQQQLEQSPERLLPL